MTWALAHPYLTTLLALATMPTFLFACDYAHHAYCNYLRARLVEKGHKP